MRGSEELVKRSELGWLEVGSFEVTSGKIVAMDPCHRELLAYSKSFVSRYVAKNGTWHCLSLRVGTKAGFLGTFPRVSKILAYHEEHPTSTEKGGWRKSGVVGVDAGVAGFFDLKEYEERCDEDWYHGEFLRQYESSRIDSVTLDFGCVSSSGYGDGGYQCYARRKDKKVVAMYIDFGVEEEPTFRPFREKQEKERQLQKAWAQASEGKDLSNPTAYDMTKSFATGEVIHHPKYGVGVVLDDSEEKKIRVQFPIGQKPFIHQRTFA